jgi:hypothetical protein
MYILQGGKLNRLEVFLGTWYIYFLIILLSKYSTVSHNITCLIIIACTLSVLFMEVHLLGWFERAHVNVMCKGFKTGQNQDILLKEMAIHFSGVLFISGFTAYGNY